MTSLFKILSEFQEASRNARVYKTEIGDYGVLMYDAESDFNAFQSFSDLQLAEDAAEDWVMGYGDSI